MTIPMRNNIDLGIYWMLQSFFKCVSGPIKKPIVLYYCVVIFPKRIFKKVRQVRHAFQLYLIIFHITSLRFETK